MRFTRGRVRELKNTHNSIAIKNRTHVYMNFFDHKNLGNHLLQLFPTVVKHSVYVYVQWVPGNFPGVKRPGHGVEQPPRSDAGVQCG